MLGDLAASSLRCQAEVDPAALGRPLHQPRLGEQLQVPADAGLALAQDAREVLHVELAMGQQRQQTQPRRLGGGLEHTDRRREAQH